MDIKTNELKIDSYSSTQRSGFAINHIDGIKITHIPTGIEAISEDERSQHKNRMVAIALLKTKLRDHKDNNKKASELLLESATPFDLACLKVKQMEDELEEISNLLEYPDKWDTMAYPTLLDAIKESLPLIPARIR